MVQRDRGQRGAVLLSERRIEFPSRLQDGVFVTHRRDPALYDLLALVDALRIGRARERSLAEKEITDRLTSHVAA